jgi:hypothetical protein
MCQNSTKKYVVGDGDAFGIPKPFGLFFKTVQLTCSIAGEVWYPRKQNPLRQDFLLPCATIL